MLGLLTDGPLSGYDLAKRARESVGYIWAPAKGHIYAVLPRLVTAGLATRRNVAQARRPDKQVYRITRAGRKALRAWLERVDSDSIDVLLLKVFFGDLVTPETVAAHVRRYRSDAAELLAEYRKIEGRIARSPRDRYRYATLRCGIARARATVRWADELLRELDMAGARR